MLLDRSLFVAVGFGLLLAACAPPKRDVKAADVPALKDLEEVMDVQATIADPQMKKAGNASYSDEDYAAFAEVSSRIQATSWRAQARWASVR